MASNPFSDPQWSERATDFITNSVEKVRSKTTQPLIYIARAIVFGLIAIVGLIVTVTLFLIGLMRLLENILANWFARDTAVWAAYFIVGGLFLAIGMFLMTKRYPKKTES